MQPSNQTPIPGLEAILQGLQQGGMPTGQLANLSMTNLLLGLSGQGQTVSGLSPALMNQLSPMLRNQVGGQVGRG